ncbi:DUF1885 family protein [Peribacillus alkalitolerans]|uniref:DUF1885 family protein n=1 Tax=Peribacillus alkalitolerans TaxID=1550385 RepID=UPI001966DC61|nr:DUF1885 family protein [Peribacillus alkalitolerans]
MAENAYIKLVPGSVKEIITTDELKDLLLTYKGTAIKTGHQLGWDYEEHAFPYEIKETENGKGRWFYLQSQTDRYNVILLGIDQEKVLDDNANERIQTYVQVSLAQTSTFGDKGKANELCKYLSKKLNGELQLFNGRIIYDYKR